MTVEMLQHLSCKNQQYKLWKEQIVALYSTLDQKNFIIGSSIGHRLTPAKACDVPHSEDFRSAFGVNTHIPESGSHSTQ